MAQYAAVPCSTPSTKVELRISCKNLRDADVFSKSDPLVAVYAHSKRKGHPWEEVRKTVSLFTAVRCTQAKRSLVHLYSFLFASFSVRSDRADQELAQPRLRRSYSHEL